ncbi:MAG TPA: BatD family protein [Saprospiraceae bacterium]|nr:BatD family protein [Saprospiraceae bacterium]
MKISLLVLFTVICTSIFAQDKSISVEISPDSVLMDNEIEVNFTVENAQVKKFDAPAFKDFELVGGPFSSSMMQIINGEMTSKQTYTYLIKPKSPGSFFIEPAFVDTKEGGTLETQPIEVKVHANPGGIIQKKNPKNQDWDEFFSSPTPRKNVIKPKPERKTFKI